MNNQSNTEKSDKDKTAPLDEGAHLEETPVDETAPNRSGTLIMQGGRGRTAQRTEEDTPQEGDVLLNGSRVIELVIRGMAERISFANRDSLTVGRADHKKAALPDIDLAKYGAAQRGVSREHIRLEIKNDQLFMTDLGSTNGTFLRGERVTAFTPYLIHASVEIALGRMVVQIIFV